MTGREVPPPAWERFAAWPLELRRAWLRHPAHGPRCSCGGWCVVYGPVIDDLDVEAMRHSDMLCQPLREVIP